MTSANHRPRWLERHWRPAIIVALLALAVASGWAIRASYHKALDQVHVGQLEACERGNRLRAAVQVNVRVLDRLLGEAARARHVEATDALSRQVREASEQASATYLRLRAATRAIPQVDCARVVPRP